VLYISRGPGDGAGKATRYGLDDPGIESRLRRDLPVQTDLGFRLASYIIAMGLQRPGRDLDHSPHLAPRLKKEYNYTSTPRLGLHGITGLTLPFLSSSAFMVNFTVLPLHISRSIDITLSNNHDTICEQYLSKI